jgi:predicted thioesterase
MVTIGIKGREEAVVLLELTAKHIGSGTVPVLATPMMIALMEKTCRLSVKPHLEAGQETVGTHVDVSHDSATPEGMTVWCESEVVEVDRRKITFRVVVYDKDGIVGQGTHERFIIDEKKFHDKMEQKRKA